MVEVSGNHVHAVRACKLCYERRNVRTVIREDSVESKNCESVFINSKIVCTNNKKNYEYTKNKSTTNL